MHLEMYEDAEKNNLDILICGYRKVDSNGDTLIEVFPKIIDECYMNSVSNYFNATWNKLYKRKMLYGRRYVI